MYSIFLASVTPELPPPAILPQVLPVTLTPTSSSEYPEGGCFPLKRGLPTQKLFRSILDAGLEDPRAVAFLELADLEHWALVPKRTRESEGDVAYLSTIG